MPSGSSSTASKYAGKDFYKILKISHTATTQEIKVAYYKLALHLHPDKHQGCTIKEAQFKQVNEAYHILSHTSRRVEYDYATGHRYNKNRRSPLPPDYRKVYTSRPPPEWKTVWDHAYHHEMHYGDGFQKMAMERLRKELKQNEYQSPLGRGFYFSNEPLEGLNGGKSNVTHNPFSKREQGPRTTTIEYSEGSLNGSTGHETISRRERIVQELHTVRSQRQQQREQQQRQQQQQQANNTNPSAESPFAQYSTHATATRHWSSQARSNNKKPQSGQAQQREEELGCVIL
jgi:curved DNA-binding protein CbpA